MTVIYIVMFLDQDGYDRPIAAFFDKSAAENNLTEFIEAHKSDPFWRLDSGHIEPVYLT